MHIRAVVAMGLHTATFASVFLRAPLCLTAQLKVGNAQCTSIGFRQRQGATSCGEVVGHWAALERGRAMEGQCSIHWQDMADRLAISKICCLNGSCVKLPKSVLIQC